MQRALAPEVSTWPSSEAQLIGGRCQDCEAIVFPLQSRCARCGRDTMVAHLLPRRGRLVTWTTQEFLPKLPYAGVKTAEGFVPFGVGLVQLDDEVRVEARLTTADPEALDFGMEVELVVTPFYVDADGDEVMTVAFAPVA